MIPLLLHLLGVAQAPVPVGPAPVPALEAQAAQSLSGRLSVMPLDFRIARNYGGSGQVTAAIDGRRLRVEGTFQGTLTRAIGAELRQGPPGIPGPKVADLEVDGGTTGSIRGSLELSGALLEAARKGHFYVVVRTEGNPDGEIRGWLVPPGWPREYTLRPHDGSLGRGRNS